MFLSARNYLMLRTSSLRHTQVLSDNLPNTLLFICPADHLNSQLTITTHHFPNPFNFDLSPACWRPPVLEIIFHLLVDLLWTSCATQKQVCVCDTVLSPYTLLKQVFSYWTKNCRFIIHSSVLIAENQGDVYKSTWKKCYVFSKLRLHLYTPKMLC